MISLFSPNHGYSKPHRLLLSFTPLSQVFCEMLANHMWSPRLVLNLEKSKNQRMLAIKYEIYIGLVNKLLHFDNEKVISPKILHRKRYAYLRKTKDIKPILYKWFQYQCSKNIANNGQIWKIKALDISKNLHIEYFKASNVWFSSFYYEIQ